jgi:hypothetical protein
LGNWTGGSQHPPQSIYNVLEAITVSESNIYLSESDDDDDYEILKITKF